MSWKASIKGLEKVFGSFLWKTYVCFLAFTAASNTGPGDLTPYSGLIVGLHMCEKAQTHTQIYFQHKENIYYNAYLVLKQDLHLICRKMLLTYQCKAI